MANKLPRRPLFYILRRFKFLRCQNEIPTGTTKEALGRSWVCNHEDWSLRQSLRKPYLEMRVVDAALNGKEALEIGMDL